MGERGKYIVIEGNDGTGKSTQVELLADYLRSELGISSITAHEPAGIPMADAIRDVIKNAGLERDSKTNLLLFTAARHEIWQRAKQQLALGTWVLSARNYLSTLAYQGYGEGLDTDLIITTTRVFTDEDYMSPDNTIVLTVSDDERKRRISLRGELDVPDTFEQRAHDFQKRVNAAYAKLAKQRKYPTIDASQSIDSIQTEIREIVLRSRSNRQKR